MPGARDGQLRIRRGGDSPPWALQMFDDDLGLWLTLGQADEEEEMVRAGIPVLRGPYVVNYTDIPHDGNTMTLWTPAVGDVLLRLFPDWQTVVQWDTGKLSIGQNVDGPAGHNSFDWAADHTGGGIGYSTQGGLDNVTTAISGDTADAVGNPVFTTAYIFHTTDPVQIQMYGTGGTDPTMGHVELYALIATAIAP